MKNYRFTIFLILLSFSMIITPVSSVETDETVSPILIIGGEQGSGKGAFNEPDSIFVSTDGLYYAGDTENLRVQIFDSKGDYLDRLTGFNEDASGNEVQGIGELNDGTIVVVEKAGGLYFFNPTNQELLNKVDLISLASLSDVDTQGLAVSPDTGNIYITNQPEELMIVVSPSGELIETWGTGSNTTPENIVIDAERDRIYVSTEETNSITIYDYNGTQLDSFGDSVSSRNFEGIALDPYGRIIAVDEGDDGVMGSGVSRIIVFDPSNYSALYSWGGTTSTTDGRFFSPDGIAYDPFNNRVLIADQGNYRIQVFDYLSILANFGVAADTTSPVILFDELFNPDFVLPTGGIIKEDLTWTIEDDGEFLLSYDLKSDSSVEPLESGHVKSGESITTSFETSTIGTYTYTLTVMDAYNNTQEHILSIEVVEESETDTETESINFQYFFTISVVMLSLIRYLKNKY